MSAHATDDDFSSLAAENQRLRKLRKAFKAHTDDVRAFVVLLEDAVRRLRGEELGHRLADLTNKLEMKNDYARRFSLDLDFNGKINALK